MNRPALSLLAAVLPSLASPAGITAEEAMSGMPCQPEIRGLLQEWDISGSVFAIPAASNGEMLYRLPTHTIGSWVLLRGDAEGARAWRVSATKVVKASWDDKCQSATADEPVIQSARDGEFADADLEALLNENVMGVLYVWSPHMLLSVNGVDEVRRISENLGVGFIALLDPNADPAFARSTVRESGLPEEALRRATALELRFRDMFVHAPSLLVYREGKISGPAIPGYRVPGQYRQTITERLRIDNFSID